MDQQAPEIGERHPVKDKDQFLDQLVTDWKVEPEDRDLLDRLVGAMERDTTWRQIGRNVFRRSVRIALLEKRRHAHDSEELEERIEREQNRLFYESDGLLELVARDIYWQGPLPDQETQREILLAIGRTAIGEQVSNDDPDKETDSRLSDLAHNVGRRAHRVATGVTRSVLPEVSARQWTVRAALLAVYLFAATTIYEGKFPLVPDIRIGDARNVTYTNRGVEITIPVRTLLEADRRSFRIALEFYKNNPADVPDFNQDETLIVLQRQYDITAEDLSYLKSHPATSQADLTKYVERLIQLRSAPILDLTTREAIIQETKKAKQ